MDIIHNLRNLRQNKIDSTAYVEHTMQEYIERYLDTYKKMLDKGDKQADSYHALTNMNLDFDETGNSQYVKQQKLFKKASKMGFSLTRDFNNSKGTANFLQFRTQGYLPEECEIEKLHINCDRDKVNQISQKLMEMSKKQKVNLCFKIPYENKEKTVNNNFRSDKIVIYTDDSRQKDDIVKILSDINRSNPRLFNKEKEVPFMPKVKGAKFISTSGKMKEEDYTNYYSLACDNNASNKHIPYRIGASYNSKLSNALLDSLIASWDICNLGKCRQTPPCFATESEIRNILNHVSNFKESYKKEFIDTMGNLLVECCKINNIPLDETLIEKNQMKSQIKKEVKNIADTEETSSTQKNIEKSRDFVNKNYR